MKKERFKEIVSSYSSNLDEVKSLQKLATDYPFSQIIHLLLANTSKSAQSKEYKPNLSNAAFHTTDRSILKSLIEHNLVPSDTKTEPIIKNKLLTVEKKVTNSTTQETIAEPKPANSSHLAEDVLKNLKELQKVKKEAAIWLEGNTKSLEKKKKLTIKKNTPKPKPTKKSKPPIPQSKLIEKFIKEEPRITKNTAPSNEKEDMAAKNSVMRDDVISESLAKIFVKQGKNKKAIDIYKKLIWKFPQKKALFAAQIEKLKKK